MKYLYFLLVITLLTSVALAKQDNTDENHDSYTTSEEATENKQSQTQKSELTIQFLYDSKQFFSDSRQVQTFNELVELGKKIEEEYKDEVQLYFIDIDKNQTMNEYFRFIKSLKSQKFHSDVICIINDRFIIGLYYIKQLLPEFINYELNPKEAFDPLARKIVRTSQTKTPETFTQTEEKDDWKSLYSVLLVIVIIVGTLVLGVVFGIVIFRKRK